MRTPTTTKAAPNKGRLPLSEAQAKKLVQEMYNRESQDGSLLTNPHRARQFQDSIDAGIIDPVSPSDALPQSPFDLLPRSVSDATSLPRAAAPVSLEKAGVTTPRKKPQRRGRLPARTPKKKTTTDKKREGLVQSPDFNDYEFDTPAGALGSIGARPSAFPNGDLVQTPDYSFASPWQAQDSMLPETAGGYPIVQPPPGPNLTDIELALLDPVHRPATAYKRMAQAQTPPTDPILDPFGPIGPVPGIGDFQMPAIDENPEAFGDIYARQRLMDNQELANAGRAWKENPRWMLENPETWAAPTSPDTQRDYLNWQANFNAYLQSRLSGEGIASPLGENPVIGPGSTERMMEGFGAGKHLPIDPSKLSPEQLTELVAAARAYADQQTADSLSIPNVLKTQTARSAIPTMLARGAFVGTSALAAPLGPVASTGIGLGASAVVGGGAQAISDALAPESERNLWAAQEQAHPLASFLGQSITDIAMSPTRSLRHLFTKEGLRMAATTGGISAAQEGGAQAWANEVAPNLPGPLRADAPGYQPWRIAAAAAVGPFSAGPDTALGRAVSRPAEALATRLSSPAWNAARAMRGMSDTPLVQHPFAVSDAYREAMARGAGEARPPTTYAEPMTLPAGNPKTIPAIPAHGLDIGEPVRGRDVATLPEPQTGQTFAVDPNYQFPTAPETATGNTPVTLRSDNNRYGQSVAVPAGGTMPASEEELSTLFTTSQEAGGFGLTAREAKRAARRYGQVAEAWADRTGGTVEDWWQTHAPVIVNGGERLARQLINLPESGLLPEGQALPRAHIDWMKDNARAIISALSAPDYSSTVHELSHLVRKLLPERLNRQLAKFAGAEVKADGSTHWTPKAEEVIAKEAERIEAARVESDESFEAVLSKLPAVFRKFAERYRDIYVGAHFAMRNLTDAERRNFNPELLSVMDEMYKKSAGEAKGQRVGTAIGKVGAALGVRSGASDTPGYVSGIGRAAPDAGRRRQNNLIKSDRQTTTRGRGNGAAGEYVGPTVEYGGQPTPVAPMRSRTGPTQKEQSGLFQRGLTEGDQPDGEKPVFKSQLRAVAEQKLPNRADVSQIRAILSTDTAKGGKGAQSGIKEQEYQWSGLDEWLSGEEAAGRRPTKKQVLDFLDNNRVEVRETVKQDPRTAKKSFDRASIVYSDGDYLPARHPVTGEDETVYAIVHHIYADDAPETTPLVALVEREFDDGTKDWVVEEQDRNWYYDNYDEAYQRAEQSAITEAENQSEYEAVRARDTNNNAPKYDMYTLPGGENYREILLTLPKKASELVVGEKSTGHAYFNGRQRVEGVEEYLFRMGDEEGSITYWPKTYGYNGNEQGPLFIVDSPALQNAKFSSLSEAKQAITRIVGESQAGSRSYKSPHWDEPNVVVHLRASDRKGPNGEKLLHVEEVQSDWHQEGRESGYKRNLPQAERDRLQAKIDALDAEQQQVKDQISELERANPNTMPPEWSTLRAKVRELQQQMEAVYQEMNGEVPDAPFKGSSWAMLAMKRALDAAVKGGYDAVIWTPGIEQVKRYEDATRQAVDRIEYRRNNGGTWSVEAFKGEGDDPVYSNPRMTPEEMTKTLGKSIAQKILGKGYGDPARQSLEDDIAFSKDMAQAMLNEMGAFRQKHNRETPTTDTWTLDFDGESEPQVFTTARDAIRARNEWIAAHGGRVIGLPRHDQVRESSANDTPEWKRMDAERQSLLAEIRQKEKELADTYGETKGRGVIEGDDLTVGGEGMKGFYDRILPAEMNRYIKKWGGSVDQLPMEVDGRTITFPVVRVTDAMKAAIEGEGQPLFQKGKEGQSEQPETPKGKTTTDTDTSGLTPRQLRIRAAREEEAKKQTAPTPSTGFYTGENLFQSGRVDDDLTPPQFTRSENQLARAVRESLAGYKRGDNLRVISVEDIDRNDRMVAIPTFTDYTKATRYHNPETGVTHTLYGGKDYPLHRGMYGVAGWAHDGSEIGRGYLNNIKRIVAEGGSPVGVVITQTPESTLGNRDASAIYGKEVRANIRLGKVDAADVAEVLKATQERLRKRKEISQSLPKNAALNEALTTDYGPNVARFLKSLSEQSFEIRRNVIQLLGNKAAAELGMPSSDAILRGMMDKSLLGLDGQPIGKGQAVALIQLHPEARDTSAGDLGVPAHRSFRRPIAGIGLGSFRKPIPLSEFYNELFTREGVSDPIKQWNRIYWGKPLEDINPEAIAPYVKGADRGTTTEEIRPGGMGERGRRDTGPQPGGRPVGTRTDASDTFGTGENTSLYQSGKSNRPSDQVNWKRVHELLEDLDDDFDPDDAWKFFYANGVEENDLKAAQIEQHLRAAKAKGKTLNRDNMREMLANVNSWVSAGRQEGAFAALGGQKAGNRASGNQEGEGGLFQPGLPRPAGSGPPWQERKAQREAEKAGTTPATPTTAKPTTTKPTTTTTPRTGSSDTRRLQKSAAEKLVKGETPDEREVASFWEFQSAARKAGMLSWLNTHTKNIAGNLEFQGLEELARTPMALVDAMTAATTTKRRTIGPTSPLQWLRASGQGLTRGVREGFELWRTGEVKDDILKGESDAHLEQSGIDRELYLGEKILGSKALGTAGKAVVWPINRIFRTLSAVDRSFKIYAYFRSIEDQAGINAANEERAMKESGKSVPSGFRGQRQTELRKNPTEAMKLIAIQDALVATFNNESGGMKAARAVRNAVRGDGSPGTQPLAIVADVAFPFVGTPSNIVERVLDYTIGSVTGPGMAINRALLTRAERKKAKADLNHQIKDWFTPDDQRQFAQTFGRGLTGLGIMTMGYMLARAGLATGYDDDAGDREKRTKRGTQANSIFVNGRWYKLDAFQPIGALFTIGATMAEKSEDIAMDPTKATLTAGAAVLKAAGESPVIKGAESVRPLFSGDSEQVSNWFADQARSYIPASGLVNAIGNLTDPENRAADTPGERIMRAIPGVRERLTPDPSRPKPSPFDPFSSVPGKPQDVDAVDADYLRRDYVDKAAREEYNRLPKEERTKEKLNSLKQSIRSQGETRDMDAQGLRLATKEVATSALRRELSERIAWREFMRLPDAERTQRAFDKLKRDMEKSEVKRNRTDAEIKKDIEALPPVPSRLPVNNPVPVRGNVSADGWL